MGKGGDIGKAKVTKPAVKGMKKPPPKPKKEPPVHPLMKVPKAYCNSCEQNTHSIDTYSPPETPVHLAWVKFSTK
eukprot:9477247-Pyramimonas_sp.AAC.1